MFSGVTRNSLVVLPLARALSLEAAPAVVVTQTLVELVALVILVRLVPRFVRDPDTPAAGRGIGTLRGTAGDRRVTGR